MRNTVIFGAGPAGLAAGYGLSKEGEKSLLVEKENRIGGLSKSFKYKGFTFDIGPHLFKTRNKEVVRLWDLLSKKKYADNKYEPRILYGKKFYRGISDIIYDLPLARFLKMVFSMSFGRIGLGKDIDSAEDWIIDARGKGAYSNFYKPREEKFWGTPLNKIEKEWYSERFKKHSMPSLIISFKNKVLSKKNPVNKNKITDTTYHPEKGSGSVYEELSRLIRKNKKVNSPLYHSIVKPFTIYHNLFPSNRYIKFYTDSIQNILPFIGKTNFLNVIISSKNVSCRFQSTFNRMSHLIIHKHPVSSNRLQIFKSRKIHPNLIDFPPKTNTMYRIGILYSFHKTSNNIFPLTKANSFQFPFSKL